MACTWTVICEPPFDPPLAAERGKPFSPQLTSWPLVVDSRFSEGGSEKGPRGARWRTPPLAPPLAAERGKPFSPQLTSWPLVVDSRFSEGGSEKGPRGAG